MKSEFVIRPSLDVSHKNVDLGYPLVSNQWFTDSQSWHNASNKTQFKCKSFFHDDSVYSVCWVILIERFDHRTFDGSNLTSRDVRRWIHHYNEHFIASNSHRRRRTSTYHGEFPSKSMKNSETNVCVTRMKNIFKSLDFLWEKIFMLRSSEWQRTFVFVFFSLSFRKITNKSSTFYSTTFFSNFKQRIDNGDRSNSNNRRNFIKTRSTESFDSAFITGWWISFEIVDKFNKSSRIFLSWSKMLAKISFESFSSSSMIWWVMKWMHFHCLGFLRLLLLLLLSRFVSFLIR